MERLGTGWMGVILELEGVCLEYPDYGNLGLAAWEQLAQEEGRSPPPKWALRRAEGMKNEQARRFFWGAGLFLPCFFGAGQSWGPRGAEAAGSWRGPGLRQGFCPARW